LNFFKTLPCFLALVLVAACGSTRPIAQELLIAPVMAQTSLRPARILQYERYKTVIKTPLRGLQVDAGFSLVDDWASFMLYHDKHVKGREGYDENALSYYGDKIDVSQCSSDLGSTDTKVSSKERDQNFPSLVNRCHNMLAQLFRIDPAVNVSNYRQIIDHWLDNDVLSRANIIQARQRREAADYAYALSSNVAKIMAHFALYHPLYDYSDDEMADVIKMFEKFTATYNYYLPFQEKGQYFAELCNLGRPTVPKGTNDHCGSFNTRMAVGATLFGLEFDSQLVFDKGIQHTEIMLATFDQYKMYTSQIWRHDALSYTDQIGPAIDQLDYALEKAFGIDFANMQTVHDVTPGEVYRHLWTVANNPALLKPYMNYKRRNDPNYYSNVPDYDGANMFSVISKIESHELEPTYIWQAFNERRYVLTVPGLAREFQPDLWRKWKPRMNAIDFDFGQRITGFSPLILREATARY
jgi:hypothetical protein